MERFDGLRRNRKALLSDLSSLVKLGKHLQDVASGQHFDECLDNVFDEMLLKAFRIVTRGVRFVDVWNEEVGLAKSMAELELPNNQFIPGTYGAPLTPPVEGSFNIAGHSASGSTESPFANPSPSIKNQNPAPMNQGQELASQQRPASAQTKRVSVSHRVSYSGYSSANRNPNVASERLGAAHDKFLGVLGSFIGLHLQSRSSTELIITTQQAVQSCRILLSVVEEILEHDMHRSESLERAKDAMYERITELVHAARDAFRPANVAEDETVFMPDNGKRLVDAATDCVRGAGDCVAKAKQVLEQIGDFELETIGLGISNVATDKNDKNEKSQNGIQPAALESVDSQKGPNKEEAQEVTKPKGPSARLPPPPLQIPAAGFSSLSLTPSLTDTGTSVSECLTATVQTPTSTLDEPYSAVLSSFADLNDPFIPHPDQDTPHSFGRYSPTKTPFDPSLHPGSAADVAVAQSYAPTTHTVFDGEARSYDETPTRPASPDTDVPPPPPLKDNVQLDEAPTETEEHEETLLEKTYAHELMFKEGQVVGGSIRALVEKLTAHESTPDALFVSTFYLTFRLFAAPIEFAEALIERYDYIGETPKAGGPVRLRVYNVFKSWLESHWRHDCDDVALPTILKFARTKLMITLCTAGKRLVDLVEKVSTLHGPLVPRLVSSIGKTNTSIAQYVSSELPLPPPVVSRSQLSSLKNWKNGGPSVSILDFDPLELARQITLKESRLFCSILPEELLGTEWTKKSASLAVNVRAMATLSTDLANLVADCILQFEEPKKRALIVKRWVKIAAKCLELNNYDTLMAIICSLNSSTISRLRRTWELVPQKTKNNLEQLREIVDVSRNYAVLRQRLQNHVPPCLPFVGTYLTDLTFVDHGNQNTRSLPIDEEASINVINFDKHMKTAKIISELQRFQIPYRLTEVPELQAWIQDQLVRVRSTGEKSFQHYYRRSLVLEPRDRAASRASPGEPSIFSKEVAKEKFDFLAWTHSSKTKGAA